MENFENKTREQLLKELEKSNKRITKLEKHKIESKQTKKELEKTRERLELAMDAGEHGFWDWNLDTNDVYFSPRYYTMLGYEPGELPMRLETWVNLMHPDDRKIIVPEVKEYVKNTQPYDVEFRLKTKNGNWRWISGRGKSYKKDEDGIIHRAIGVHVDITERKQAEETLKQSEKNYRDLFNNASDAIYIQDREHRFIDVNQGAVYMYGYPKKFFIGKTSGFLSAPGKNDLEKIAGFVEDAFNGKPRQYDFWGIRKNGEVFPKIVRSQKSIYMGKEVVVTFASDITERKEAEEKIQHLNLVLRAIRNVNQLIVVEKNRMCLFKKHVRS